MKRVYLTKSAQIPGGDTFFPGNYTVTDEEAAALQGQPGVTVEGEANIVTPQNAALEPQRPGRERVRLIHHVRPIAHNAAHVPAGNKQVATTPKPENKEVK
jgi:hypothetical protein